MLFITQGKSNLKYILIVVILALGVGAGILGYQWWIAQKEVKIPEIKIPEKEKPQEETIKSEEVVGIAYKSSLTDGSRNELKIKNFYTGEEILISDLAYSSIVSIDGKNIYYSQFKDKNLVIYQYFIEEKSAKEIYKESFNSKILGLGLHGINNGVIGFMISLKDISQEVDFEENLDVPVIQQFIIYDIDRNKEDVIYNGKHSNAYPIDFLAVSDDDYYFIQYAFEGPSSLLRFDKNSQKLENLTEVYQFSFREASVSPDKRYLAMATLTRESDDRIVSRLSFYDLQNKELIHSQLIARDDAVRYFVYGETGFRYLDWVSDSSFVYVGVGEKITYPISGETNKFFPQKEYVGDYKYYFVNPDGNIIEQQKLKEIESEIQIVKLIDSKTALAIKKDNFSGEKISLVLFDLNTYQIRKTILVQIGSYIWDFNGSFVGLIK